MEENGERLSYLFEDLTNLAYAGKIKSVKDLSIAFLYGEPNYAFHDIVTWLSSNLGTILRLENSITIEIEDSSKAAMLEVLIPNPLAFYVELSSLLKELNCPIKQLISGVLENRFKEPINRLLTIDFMIQELRAAKLVQYKNPQMQKPIEIQLSESKTARELKQMLITLNFSKPPQNIKAVQIFQELEKRICSLSQPLLPTDKIPEILQVNALTESQWYTLERLYSDFVKEYKNRREMVMQRVSLTIASFFWPERIQKQEKLMQNINNIFFNFQKNVSANPDVQVSDLISATADMAIRESVSSGAACKNTRSQVTKVTIGEVPDRGGRPNEQAPPPPEVPSWKERSEPSKGPPYFSKPNERHDAQGKDFRPQYTRGNNFSRGANYQNHRPRQGIAPMPVQVAGDNFAQFGNVPVGTIMVGHQIGSGGVPVMINPAANMPATFQYGYGGPPVVPAFGGHSQHGRGGNSQHGRGGNSQHGRGGHYQNNRVQRGHGGRRNQSGFGGFGPNNAYSG